MFHLHNRYATEMTKPKCFYSKNADFEKIRCRAITIRCFFLAVLRGAQHGLYTRNLLPTPMAWLHGYGGNVT